MKLTKTTSGKSKFKCSKKEWESIGKKAGWVKESQMTRYYLETYIDGVSMVGSDWTTVLHSTSPKNIKEELIARINVLKRLSHNVKPFIKDANEIVLKLVKMNGNEESVLQEWDVTEEVQKVEG